MRRPQEIAEAYALLIDTATGRLPSALEGPDLARLRLMSLGLAWVLDLDSGGDLFASTLSLLRRECEKAGLRPEISPDTNTAELAPIG
ncbi:MAG: hypothetical protein A3E01_10680 [Gammaproteobacteria bacterium RIFCSPHIGHO2_12_FULL_63_22]|nr:MAG: hypothetical protein A3E01_10680 [Gammaproteobacteria bacterium RIFCSPHIGHO2_12_FULL_63_22]